MLTNKGSLLIMSTHVRLFISCSPLLSNVPALFPFLGLKISSNIRSGNLIFVFPFFSAHLSSPTILLFTASYSVSAVSSEGFPQSSVVLSFSFLLIYFIVSTRSGEIFFFLYCDRFLYSLISFLYPLPKQFQFLLGLKIIEYAELEGTHDSDDFDDSDDSDDSSE